jgi:UDP-N-acetylglucosamine acyltransferase
VSTLHTKQTTTVQASSFEEAFFHSSDTYIHPTAVIGDHVTLGKGVKVGPFCTVIGNTTIGENTRLHAHVTVGFPGQVVGVTQSLGTINIGSNCDLREFVTVHAARTAQGATVIGDNCYLMHYAHVAHDAVLGNNIVLNPNVNLGGHTEIADRAVIMTGSATHQFCKIGRLTALAPFSGIRQDLPPFCIFNGKPAAFFGLNLIGLRRNGAARDSINALKRVTKLFFQDKLPTQTIIAAVAADSTLQQDPFVQEFMAFIHGSQRGVSRRCGTQQDSSSPSTEIDAL